MSRSALLSAIAVATLLPAALSAARLPPNIAGSYRVPGGAIITIAACGAGKMCGHIAVLGDLATTDANNPETELQSRPLCGVKVLDRIEPSDHYWLGVLYDPHNGTEYNISVARAANGRIDVSGHTTQPFLSRTFGRQLEVWEKVPAPATPCDPARLTS
jgi:uncharacterized protein (DUF2147 family)